MEEVAVLVVLLVEEMVAVELVLLTLGGLSLNSTLRGRPLPHQVALENDQLLRQKGS